MRVLSARAVIVKDEKLFCVKNKVSIKSDTVTDYWCLPGGSVEEFEPIESAAEREIIEELGIKPKIGELKFIQQFKNSNNDFIEFFFLVENPEDYMSINKEQASHFDAEIADYGFINPKSNIILPEFLKEADYKKLQSQPLQIFNYL